jgi:hypothetical protein
MDGSLDYFVFPGKTLSSSGEECALELHGAACDHFSNDETRMPDAAVSEEEAFN